MPTTRVAFTRLARDFGLVNVPPSRAAACFAGVYTAPTPQCGVAGWRREVAVNDAFLAAHTRAQSIFTLGHEAGHIVMEHAKLGRRVVWAEIEADMWGLEACRAYGVPLDSGVSMMRAYRDLFASLPGYTRAAAEMDARILAQNAALKGGLDAVGQVLDMVKADESRRLLDILAGRG